MVSTSRELIRVIESLGAAWNADFTAVKRRQLNGSAAVLQMGNVNHVFVADDMPRRLLPFLLLHEMAHLELGTLARGHVHDPDVERQANLWALDRLVQCLDLSAVEPLYASLEVSEDALFEHLAATFEPSEELHRWMNTSIIGLTPIS